MGETAACVTHAPMKEIGKNEKENYILCVLIKKWHTTNPFWNNIEQNSLASWTLPVDGFKIKNCVFLNLGLFRD